MPIWVTGEVECHETRSRSESEPEQGAQSVGFINCGGCPGKKAVLRARSLVEQGADTIAFASCISKGTPIGYPCPFAKRMRELVQKEVGDGVRILDYTQDAGPEPETSQK